MWRACAVVVSIFLGACSSRPTCSSGDLECLAASFSINDFSTYDDTSKRDKLTTLTVPLPTTTSPKLGLVIDGALNFASASDGALLLFSWRDTNGCRPSMCMSHCPRGVRCVTGARCTPSRRDGLTQSTTTHWVEYGSDPAVDTDFDLSITPASATGCPTDVAALIEAGDASVSFGPAFIIPVHLPAPGGGGGGGDPVCGDDLRASTLNCTPIGSGGVADTCISDAEYRGIFGVGRPASCAPAGTQGCMDTQKGALVKPCCPGLSCNVGSACGGGSVLGGVCQ
jgi:hypothetical protein